MALIPVPGIGSANLEKTTNLAAWLDNLLLSGHMWSVNKGLGSRRNFKYPACNWHSFNWSFNRYWLQSKKDYKTKTVWLICFSEFF